MAAKAPYQPSLLRLLHAGTAIAVIAIWLSALLIYGHYVGGWYNPAWIS